MLAFFNGWARLFAGPSGVIARAIVGVPHDPELVDAFRGGVIGWCKQAMAETVARGEVGSDVRVDIARELGPALLWHRSSSPATRPPRSPSSPPYGRLLATVT
jgi:hypothetical protein